MINWSGIQASVCNRISTLTQPELSRVRFQAAKQTIIRDPRFRLPWKACVGLSILLQSTQNRSRERQADSLVSAYQEPTWNQQVNLSNETQRQQESLRVTVGIYKLMLIELDWINYEYSFILLSLKFIPGKLSINAAFGRVLIL